MIDFRKFNLIIRHFISPTDEFAEHQKIILASIGIVFAGLPETNRKTTKCEGCDSNA